MNELLTNSSVLQLAMAACCVIISIGITGAMIVGAVKRTPTQKENDEVDSHK